MERIGSITRGQPVYADTADSGAVEFAKALIRNEKGGWREPHTVTERTVAADMKAEEAFDAEWKTVTERTGFGGSGTVVYIRRGYDEAFRVESSANAGRTFWDTDHRVSRVAIHQGVIQS